jgi:SNF2 family DNA or RNA helicase
VESGSELKLKPYQQADVAFLATAGQALLANEPGLGKTASLIRTLQVLKAACDHTGGTPESPFPALVICPNSLKITVWLRELEKWAPELSAMVIDGSAGARRKQFALPAEIYIMNWDLLRYHSKLAAYGQTELTDAQKEPKELNGFGQQAVILDEAHHMLHPQSQQTRAAWAVMKEARYRYALTGTPVGDHVGDLWGILHGLIPEGFPGKTRYMDRYALTTWGIWGGIEVLGIRPDTAEEFRRVTEPVMRRMLKKAVLPQLPPKLPTAFRHTPMSPKQAKAYKQMQEEMAARLDEDILVAADPLSKLTRLLQLAAASAEITEDGRVQLTTPSSKVDDLVELLEELGDEPLVVAAVSRQLINLAAARLEKEKISFGLVTGGQDMLERDTAISRFQSGKIRVILFTLGTGAEGLTLTRASKLLFMQESWRTLENQQAEDRIYRIGSEHHSSIQIIKQITPGTIEEAKIQVLEGKLKRVEEVIRDREALARLIGIKEVKGTS